MPPPRPNSSAAPISPELAASDAVAIPPLTAPYLPTPEALDALNRVLDAELDAELERPPEWRVHDRTHLEVVIDYRLDGRDPKPEYEWDVYFFVPDSLRLYQQTYEKHEIYDDLLSYVRLDAPGVTLAHLAGAPCASLERAFAQHDRAVILRELRLFACMMRTAVVSAERALRAELANARGESDPAVRVLVAQAQAVTQRFRSVVETANEPDPELREAIAWVDEDVSRVIETSFAHLAMTARKMKQPEELVTVLSQAAANEARYRRAQELDGVGGRTVTDREVEHLEFRRHVLKRFTSAVLWLDVRVREAGAWVRQVLFGIAASVAMGVAFAAAMVHGSNASQSLWATALAVVLAYAAKDRIKASLQSAFTNLVSRVFPDRRWQIYDRSKRSKKDELARVYERSGFVGMKTVPPAALALRRSARRHRIEEEARPEQVLWHHKTFTLNAEAIRKADPRFSALSEIFRLNLRRWLDHTDDPKRKILMADPDDGQIYSATAKRVYNIAVIYRLQRVGGPEVPWQRARVVVTRKGILRVDLVTMEGDSGMQIARA